MVIDKEQFKNEVVDLLFNATRTEELSSERIFEVVDIITDDLIDAANRLLLIK